MAVSLSVKNLKRYRDIAALFLKYGRSDLARGMGLSAGAPAKEAEVDAQGRDLARDLERLGPTFVKLGQLVSCRSDLFPPPVLAALARLQDKVEPFPYDEVERIVERELRVRISRAFSEFDPVPVAAASLGQVHRARLRDGRLVAVKVQRPGIRDQIFEDLDAFDEAARFLDAHSELAGRYDLAGLVAEFRRSLTAELDYRQEAHNARVLRTNLEEFERLVVPEPLDDYTAERVLTMDYVHGAKITALSPLVRIDWEGDALAGELFRGYLKQVLVDGFFHADPHPGNVFVTDDGRVALLDLGMVARLPDAMQEGLLKLLFAVAEGRGDEAADRAAEIGQRQTAFDAAAFRRRIGPSVGAMRDASLDQVRVGDVLLELTRGAAENGLRLPSELGLLAKTLLQLDRIGKVLAPEFDPTGEIRRYTAELLRRRVFKSVTPGALAGAVLDAKELAEKLPGRVNRVLDLLAANELRLRVDTIDERSFLEGLQKIANRIALGVILAALILGAALLMHVPTNFRIFGYPGLAMIFFLGAAAGGLGLIAAVLWSDRRARAERSPPG